MRPCWILPLLLAAGCALPAATPANLERESLWLAERGGIRGVYGERPAPAPERAAAPAQPPMDAAPAHGPRQLTRGQLLEEVDHGWVRPRIFERAADPLVGDEHNQLRERLEAIVVPRVEFRELPLSQVIETLAEISAKQAPDGQGLNMVLIDPEGRDPRVSILLRRLSLKRILDFVTESTGCEYDLQSDAVVIRPRRGPGAGMETAFYPVSRSTLIRLTGMPEMEGAAAAAALRDPFAPPEGEPADRRVEAERALKSFLQRAGIPFDGIDGANLALADGQLIVTQTPRNHEKVRRLLRRYREVKQVEIEARFLEVQERNLEELGFEWTLLRGGRPILDDQGLPLRDAQGRVRRLGADRFSNAPTRNLANAFTVGQQESRIVIDRPGLNLPEIGRGVPVMPMTVDLAQEAGSLVALSSLIHNADLGLLIRALERQSGNDLLSAPRVTVLSGKTAEIVVAEEFRYPEMYGDTNAEVGRGDSSSGSAGVAITAGTPRSFTTRNVGVEMEVTPTVEEDNSISLRLKPKVTEFEGFVEYGGSSVAIASDTTVTVPSGFYQPVFSVRKVQTEVTIWDGATVVMGGLTREHAVRVSDRVPVLGSLPLLGRFFRQEGESTQKRNLLIFVTANLVSPGGSPAFQYLPGVEPNSVYQNPLPATPAGPARRAR